MTGRPLRGVRDPACDAHVVSRRPLLYAHGEDLAKDRPAHVRSGSAIGRLSSGKLVVVQDDAAFLAIVEPRARETSADVLDVPLPAGPDGVRLFDDLRGNKHAKLDLESCVVTHGDLLVAFGSGSTPARQQVVLASLAGEPFVRVVWARELYAAFAEQAFAGSSLNVEGAALDGDDIVFFQRGNGAPSPSLVPVDATARVPFGALLAHLEGRGPCPALRDVRAWDLGSEGGVRITFTDGAFAPHVGLAFLACAEASPDATRDGPVSGAFIGLLDDRAGAARFGAMHDERGVLLLDKCEGVSLDPEDRGRAWVVVDRDDPGCPSDLLEVRLGPAFAAP